MPKSRKTHKIAIFRARRIRQHAPRIPTKRRVKKSTCPFCPAFARTGPGERQLARKTTRRSGSLVTIHDVARHAGFSPMTVSRVINSENNVREETRSEERRVGKES